MILDIREDTEVIQSLLAEKRRFNNVDIADIDFIDIEYYKNPE